MKAVYVLSDNIITSLGFTTAENMTAVRQDTIGIMPSNDSSLYPSPVSLSRVSDSRLNELFSNLLATLKDPRAGTAFTRLEKLFILSISDALAGSGVDPADPRTLLVLSTTKGNIDLLEERNKMAFSHKRLYLWEMARVIRQFFGFTSAPVIISNACISGVVAIMNASRYLRTGLYDHAVVSGGDIATEFVISGFMSFQALSPSPCQPFDLNRTGLSLGEGCGTLVLSVNPEKNTDRLVVLGAATSNDANHISGPSRTGAELAHAIVTAMNESGVTSSEIDYISAHGTATPFNDEMESRALAIAQLTATPLNSMKGYWGHTLGAAGVIESVAALASLRNNILYRSAGFEEIGVPEPVNVITEHQDTPLRTCLKTASGFGGCNAAILFQKEI